MGVEKSKDVEGTLYPGMKSNGSTFSFVLKHLLSSRAGVHSPARGIEVGNLVEIPKSKAGSGAWLPAPNSYANLAPLFVDSCFARGSGVVSGVGGNSNLNSSILGFSWEKSLVVIPKSKVGIGTCFPAPNSYVSNVILLAVFFLSGSGVASGVGGNSTPSIFIFPCVTTLGVNWEYSADAVTLMLEVFVIVKVLDEHVAFGALVGVAGGD
jgi:hypothetical protein